MKQFEALGLSNEVLSVLKEAGFKSPSEIQTKAIPLALAGKDVVGESATGSGKTLVFAAPIIEKLIPNGNVQSLILTPTRELAEQVAVAIKHFSKNKRINILAIYGGVDIKAQIRKISRTDVVVGTPGRILDHLKRKTLNLSRVNILVLDEVDRMFDMGFSRDVETILKQCPVKRQTMMFSATVSSQIDHLIKKYTINAVKVSAKNQVDPSKLKQIYYNIPSNQKFSLLVHLLKEEPSNLVMVFCSTRRNVDFVANHLDRLGIPAQAIHGGLTQNNRSKVLDHFQRKNVRVLVCTDVAGRGLDIKEVTHVYNYNMPQLAQDYIHRIGRTARAGKEGMIINLISSDDYFVFGKINENRSVYIREEKLPDFERVFIRPEIRRNFSRPRDFRRRETSHRRLSRRR